MGKAKLFVWIAVGMMLADVLVNFPLAIMTTFMDIGVMTTVCIAFWVLNKK